VRRRRSTLCFGFGSVAGSGSGAGDGVEQTFGSLVPRAVGWTPVTGTCPQLAFTTFDTANGPSNKLQRLCLISRYVAVSGVSDRRRSAASCPAESGQDGPMRRRRRSHHSLQPQGRAEPAVQLLSRTLRRARAPTQTYFAAFAQLTSRRLLTCRHEGGAGPGRGSPVSNGVSRRIGD
jgi:hypothetical protein